MNAVQSKNYKTWVAVMDGRTCLQCKKLNGKIYYMNEIPYPQRIVFSNDGLVFVTYDHYETFYEII